jgi:hypothetical protein
MNEPMVTGLGSPSPTDLGPVAGTVVQCLAGELTERAAARATGLGPREVRRRVALMAMEHFGMPRGALMAMPLQRRRWYAEEIVKAELARPHPAPGAQVVRFRPRGKRLLRIP